MWVFEETLPNGEKLTDVINKTNENVKYLPGVKLVKDANMLVFVSPHQFMEGICKQLVGKIRTDAEGISLVKGMEVKKEGPCMISTLISNQLGINCSVLMGANIANEIAMENFSEATVGYRQNKEAADKWVQLFDTPYFNVTSAAIMRIGLKEMIAFSRLLFPSVKDSTFFESCGVADLITTCMGGRNRKVAEAYAQNRGKRSFDELEAEMLKGQKLQGVLTAKEVYEVLTARGWVAMFPLFTAVYKISSGLLPPSAIVEFSNNSPKRIRSRL
ncbi:hypothetical protein TSUD_165260 [Trifolium subterraneum]|uniref:Glycerol-3-phosphate dehydrogenase [NAD(+)] n=1 Tax=Trifolium subterraneum TaxID=3900 RepID=A0A2Z6MBC9_TRISU|nr:hypothetical protein TSUD_165260 [Trifolium subterraneum]